MERGAGRADGGRDGLPSLVLLVTVVGSIPVVPIDRRSFDAAMLCVQLLLLSGYLLLIRRGWSLTRTLTDPIASLALRALDRAERANGGRVYLARAERGNATEAFFRMLNLRFRWTLALATLVVVYLVHGRFDGLWTVETDRLSDALQVSGTALLVVSAVRGRNAIARDTTGVLLGEESPHLRRVRSERHYCERLLAVSAFTIDGAVGFVLLLSGLLLS